MKNKYKAILSYLFGLIGGLIFLYSKDSNRWVRQHAAQGLTLFIVYIIASFLFVFLPIPFIDSTLSVVYALTFIFGIVKANKEEEFNIPIITELANSLFGKQIAEGDSVK